MAWFKTWFDTPYYHILYSDRDYSEAENFITLLVGAISLPQNAKIIDLACGKGRHSVFLNKLGFDVLGLDLSKESIEHNKQFENSSLQFEVHDMRDEIFPEISTSKVDAVMNLFTSFGYFEDPEDDRKVFESVKNVLKDGGIFVLDFLNEGWVSKTLVEAETKTRQGMDFEIRKRIENHHVIKDIFFEDKGEQFHFFEKVKLHTLPEIEIIAKDFGFEILNIYGDYQLADYHPENSPRCITVFQLTGDKR